MDIAGNKKIQVQITINADVFDDGDVLTEQGHLNQKTLIAIKKNFMDVVNSHFCGVVFDTVRVIKEEE
jgi:hypothetical protein